MRQYLSFFRIRFVAGLQYRTAAFAGFFTQLFWGLMEIMLFRAFYLYAPEKLPMDIQALSSYIWIQQSTLCIWNLYGWEQELFESVRSGAVAYELVRPTDLYAMWSARGFAGRLSKTLPRLVPVLIVGSLLPAPYGLRLTISFGTFLLFLVSVLLMLWLVVAICMLCYTITFYVTDYRGIVTFVPALSEIFSGDLIPLPFFPPVLRRIAELSPFGSLQNVPLRIFGGDIAGAQIPGAMGLQLFWCLFLTALGYALMHRGLRRTVIAGG